MEDLIRRIEEAREGSRELDWLVHKAVQPWLEKAVKWDLGFVDVDGSSDEDCLLWWAEDRDEPYHDHLPHYTTSIDAALGLVPEGWGGRIMLSGVAELWFDAPKLGEVCESLRNNETPRAAKHRVVGASEEGDPALALTAAALKARKEMER